MERAAIAFSAAMGVVALSPPRPHRGREGGGKIRRNEYSGFAFRFRRLAEGLTKDGLLRRGAYPLPVHPSATLAAKLPAMRHAAVLAVLLALAAPAVAQPAHYGLSQSENDRFLTELAARPGILKLPNGVLYRVLATGTGAAPASRADKVTVSYTGVLINGSRFGASDPTKPSVFTISRTIPGWAIALMQMKEGDRWEVIVPADQAYGGGSAGAVPPDQTLVFTLTLVHVEHAS